ncbi:unnamed protein product [Schistosoma spindalis]|nr:unnamed protein product [Schistosoma spindale]
MSLLLTLPFIYTMYHFNETNTILFTNEMTYNITQLFNKDYDEFKKQSNEFIIKFNENQLNNLTIKTTYNGLISSICIVILSLLIF